MKKLIISIFICLFSQSTFAADQTIEMLNKLGKENVKKKAPLEQNWWRRSLSDEFNGPMKTFPAKFWFDKKSFNSLLFS